MTSKERWRAVVARQGTDRLPTDYWGTGEITAKLRTALGVADDEALWKALDIDKGHHAGPELRDPFSRERGEADIWGIKVRRIEHAGGAGSYDEVYDEPLASFESVAQLEAYRWPDPAWWSHDSIPAQIAAQPGWPIFGGSFEPFYLYSRMRGVELAMEDLAERPAFLECALQRIFDIHYALIERTLMIAKGGVDFVYIAEDLGTQESLLFSPAMFRTFLKPRMKKMIELVHRHGAYAFHHDDGAIFTIIPDLLDAGIDLLNPIQWRCAGMDRAKLKSTFGSKVAFHGAMDNQKTLPFRSVAEVRAEVRENARILGTGGGYILAPCHNLQSITPVENVLAMYDEAKKL